MKTQSTIATLALLLLTACSADSTSSATSARGASQGLSLSTIDLQAETKPMSLEVKKRRNQGRQLETEVTWMDGDKERRVWLDEQVLVEFSPESAADAWLSARARVLETSGAGQGRTRHWVLNDDLRASSLLAEMEARGAAANFSPGYRASASEHGALMALPGGVLVYMDPQLERPAAEQWLGARGLTIQQKMSYGTGVYLVQSSSGADCLELASSLLESEEVVKTIPNWWRAMRAQ